MKLGMGKSKGSGFENQVAKILGEWWCGISFRRTPCSGGWDKSFKGRDNFVLAPGDIQAPPEVNFPWITECKKDESWKLENLISTRATKNIFNAWFAQVEEDAQSAGKLPLLVFSKNFSPIFVAVTELPPVRFGGVLADRSCIFIYHRLNEITWYIMDIERFKELFARQRPCQQTEPRNLIGPLDALGSEG